MFHLTWRREPDEDGAAEQDRWKEEGNRRLKEAVSPELCRGNLHSYVRHIFDNNTCTCLAAQDAGKFKHKGGPDL